MLRRATLLALSLLPLPASGLWNFSGQLPEWEVRYPDWDCRWVPRAAASGSRADGWDVAWDTWARALETTPMQEWIFLSEPYLEQINALGVWQKLDLEEQAAVEMPCFLGLLTAALMQHLRCIAAGVASCSHSEERAWADVVQRLLRHDRHHFGMTELLGTRWPVLELLSAADYQQLPFGKSAEDLCNDVPSPLLPWGLLLDAFSGTTWFEDARDFVYEKKLQASWTAAPSECLYGFSMIIFWKLHVCLQFQAECVDQYLGHFNELLHTRDWLDLAGTPWRIFEHFAENRGRVRRHVYDLDFLPEELAGTSRHGGLQALAAAASEAYSQAVRSVTEHVPTPYAAVDASGVAKARLLVYVTMVFGATYNAYIPRFVQRAQAVGITSLVIFTLDEDAMHLCTELLGSHHCVRGTPSILNKFTLPLVYLDLGVDVFWIDFDVFLFADPTPMLLHRAEETGAELLVSGSFADDCICTGVVFFMSTDACTSWLRLMLSWFYEHTFEHDQQTFSAFLAPRADVDNATSPESVSSSKLFQQYLDIQPPPWALLDPVTAVISARVLNTTGWTGDAKDVVIFHFLHGDSEINRAHAAHGWNARHGERDAQKASLLDIFYGQDDDELYTKPGRPPGWSAPIEEALAESWRPFRPKELLHCGAVPLNRHTPGREDAHG